MSKRNTQHDWENLAHPISTASNSAADNPASGVYSCLSEHVQVASWPQFPDGVDYAATLRVVQLQELAACYQSELDRLAVVRWLQSAVQRGERVDDETMGAIELLLGLG